MFVKKTFYFKYFKFKVSEVSKVMVVKKNQRCNIPACQRKSPEFSSGPWLMYLLLERVFYKSYCWMWTHSTHRQGTHLNLEKSPSPNYFQNCLTAPTLIDSFRQCLETLDHQLLFFVHQLLQHDHCGNLRALYLDVLNKRGLGHGEQCCFPDPSAIPQLISGPESDLIRK